ncbi:MAG TPA: PEGA domain-containing protein, partial [Campylobacterales bacterium]|nr:PEGA domain-containing protein [Campylobacterales bacterium]
MKNYGIAFSVVTILALSGCGEAIHQSKNISEEQRLLKLKKKGDNIVDGVITEPKYIPTDKIELYQNEKRTALVIGNNNYIHLQPLRNSINDARAVAKKLENLGFEVVYLEDGTSREIRDKVDEFVKKLKSKKGVGLFYYAGHGLELGGVNYLVPVEANIKKRMDIKYESISLSDILLQIENSKDRLNVVILDACRANPFAKNDYLRAVLGDGKGFTTPPPAKGLYIAYSADVGEWASDGKGNHSVFTKSLLKHIDREGLKLNDIFKLVREEVEKETNGKQSPASYDKTTGDFFFVLPKKRDFKVVDIASNGVIGKSKIDIQEEKQHILTINTTPKDAKVEFISPEGKKFQNNQYLEDGSYKIRISKEGYFSKDIDIKLDRDIVLNVQLEKSHFKMVINTYPKNAKIEIEGIDNYSKDRKYPKGTYKFKVSKKGYFSKKGTIVLNNDVITNITLKAIKKD